MIAPDMATMLAFVFTDAPLSARVLQKLLSDGVTDQPRGGARSHLEWARRHFGPWVVSGLRGKDYRQGMECKRPTPTMVEVERERTVV